MFRLCEHHPLHYSYLQPYQKQCTWVSGKRSTGSGSKFVAFCQLVALIWIQNLALRDERTIKKEAKNLFSLWLSNWTCWQVNILTHFLIGQVSRSIPSHISLWLSTVIFLLDMLAGQYTPTQNSDFLTGHVGRSIQSHTRHWLSNWTCWRVNTLRSRNRDFLTGHVDRSVNSHTRQWLSNWTRWQASILPYETMTF